MLLAGFLFSLACGSAVGGEPGDEGPLIEAMLVIATNDETRARPVDDALDPYLRELRETFGYRNFSVIGRDVRELAALGEEWMIPSRDIYLKLSGRRIGPEVAEIYTELYQDDRLLVGVDAQLVFGEPLFIRGPQWGRRQLVVVLLARED